jgi:hypothetical protein
MRPCLQVRAIVALVMPSIVCNPHRAVRHCSCCTADLFSHAWRGSGHGKATLPETFTEIFNCSDIVTRKSKCPSLIEHPLCNCYVNATLSSTDLLCASQVNRVQIRISDDISDEGKFVTAIKRLARYEDVLWSGGMASCILGLYTRRRLNDRSTSRPFWTQDSSRRYTTYSRLGRPKCPAGCLYQESNLNSEVF